jgi:hypothetical protein
MRTPRACWPCGSLTLLRSSAISLSNQIRGVGLNVPCFAARIEVRHQVRRRESGRSRLQVRAAMSVRLASEHPGRRVFRRALCHVGEPSSQRRHWQPLRTPSARRHSSAVAGTSTRPTPHSATSHSLPDRTRPHLADQRARRGDLREAASGKVLRCPPRGTLGRAAAVCRHRQPRRFGTGRQHTRWLPLPHARRRARLACVRSQLVSLTGVNARTRASVS